MSERTQAKGKEVTGSAKEKLGKATGNEEMEAEGAAEKMEGKTKGAIGKAKDKVGDVKDKVTR